MSVSQWIKTDVPEDSVMLNSKAPKLCKKLLNCTAWNLMEGKSKLTRLRPGQVALEDPEEAEEVAVVSVIAVVLVIAAVVADLVVAIVDADSVAAVEVVEDSTEELQQQTKAA